MRADDSKSGNVFSRTFAKVRGFLSRLFYIVGLVWEASPISLIIMCLLCLLDGTLPVLGAYITRDIMNSVSELIGAEMADSSFRDAMVTLAPLMILFLYQMIYLFLRRVLTRIDSMISSIAGELVVNQIKLKIITKAKEVDQRSFDDPSFYGKLENANREAGMRPLHILTATFKVISSVITVISFIAVLVTLSPFVPLIIVVASVPGAVVNYYFRNRNFRYIRRHSKERRQMNYYSGLMTNKDSAKEIKILGLADTFTEKYNEAFKGYYKGLKRIITKECLMQVSVSAIYVIASAALFAYTAYDVVYHGGAIGDYSLYTGALNSITTYVSTVVTSTATIYEGTLFIENMLDYMKETPTVVPSIPNPAIPSRGVSHTLEFRDVSFRYPGTERDVIKHVNLTLRSDEPVILVGLNGAGKSTLLKLIMRLYDPTDGVILLDGRDIKEYDTAALYDMYGIIFQDFGKYADTVSENIRFGDVRREHSEEDVRRAAELGGAAEFIEELPEGYNTPLTRLFEDGGIELSGGQWQKLSIARAFSKKSDILIMDEPTASLDPLAEQDVINRFAELSRGKISILVSHRLTGAVTASQIVVLADGEISEIGTHDELMEKQGSYYLLFTTQAQRYISTMEKEN